MLVGLDETGGQPMKNTSNSAITGSQLHEIANLYLQRYDPKTKGTSLNNSQIGDKLKIPARDIPGYVVEAVQRGIIEMYHRKDETSLEEGIMQKYKHVREVQIVDAHDDYGLLVRDLGKVGAQWLNGKLKLSQFTEAKIGVTGGESVHAVIQELHDVPRPITIAPLALFCRCHCGAPVVYDAPYIAMNLFWKTKSRNNGEDGSKAYICALPPLPKARDKAKSYSGEAWEAHEEVRSAFETATTVDIALVRVHARRNAGSILTAYERLGISEALLERCGVIGGLNFNLFDQEGKLVALKDLLSNQTNKKTKPANGTKNGLNGAAPVHPLMHEFLLACNLEHFRNMAADKSRFVVLISGGPTKFKAIKAALTAKLANVLITDRDTAKQLAQD
jgi:DNA-binding transcriptional regulator LsrR (DeoR family)